MELTRHQKLYILDGDIVLSAPKKDDPSRGIVFRIHKGILSYHSPIFSGILSIPSSPASNEVYDGTILIRLADDAEDLAALLEAIYDPSTLQFKHMDPNLPIVARGILTVATKYEIHSIRQCIVKRLEFDWPQTLRGWENLVASKGTRLEPAAAIRLATEFDIPSILPAAFYALVQINPEQEWSMSGDIVRGARWDMLHAEDYRRYVRGKHNLAVKMKEMYNNVFKVDGACCESLTRCRKTLNEACRGDAQDFLLPDPLRIFIGSWSAKKLAVCLDCHLSVIINDYKAREELWEGLPEIFQLPKTSLTA